MTKLSFTKCPEGHDLPREGCTPLYCGGVSIGEQLTPKSKKAKAHATQGRAAAKTRVNKGATITAIQNRAIAEMKATPLGQADLKALEREEDEEHKEKTAQRVGKRIVERAVRMALLKLPAGLTGADAEEWADKKAVELLPSAMAEIEYQLYYGDDGQRREAARDVLDMTGRRRREGGGTVVPTIVLNLGGGNMLPWERTVNAEVATGTTERLQAGQDAATRYGPAGSVEVDGGRGKAGS